MLIYNMEQIDINVNRENIGVKIQLKLKKKPT